MFKFPWFRRRTTSAYADTVPARAPAKRQDDAGTRESGWLLSSVDLHSGLQVLEGEHSAPGELDPLDKRRGPNRRS